VCRWTEFENIRKKTFNRLSFEPYIVKALMNHYTLYGFQIPNSEYSPASIFCYYLYNRYYSAYGQPVDINVY
jgi:hypothetical protein